MLGFAGLGGLEESLDGYLAEYDTLKKENKKEKKKKKKEAEKPKRHRTDEEVIDRCVSQQPLLVCRYHPDQV
jgi:hypothetical protein